MSASKREYDLVLFGATGYTGLYTAEHIATAFPTNLSWAIAGRSRDKLQGVANTIKSLNADRKEPAIEIAQLTETDLNALAKRTRCILNTVGPYCKYGEPVVKACAQNGTHYLDVTGEAPWVKDMVEKYHEKAKSTGAIIVPEIGLESSPADMVTYAVSKYVREKFSAPTKEVIFTTHELKMGASGGTLATVMEIFNVYSLLQLAKSGTPSATCPIPPPKYSSPGLAQKLTGIRSVSDLGTLTTSIQTASDLPIVYRSWGLRTQGGESYGPNFTFSPQMTVRNAFIGTMLHYTFTFAPLFLAIPPIRWLMAKYVYAPGSGPSREESQEYRAEWRAIGLPDSQTKDKAFASLKFNGGAYLMTGITLSEGARTILYSKDTMAHKLGGGVLTPATLGDAYLENLEKAGLEIQLKTISD